MTEEEMKQEEFFRKLGAFKFDVNIGRRAPKSDYDFLRVFREGEEEHSIEKIYTFIDGYERGGCAAWDECFSRILKKAFSMDPGRVLKILENRERFLEQYLMISSSDIKMICYYAMNEEREPLLIFECLRQLYERFGRGEDRENIVCAAVRLSKADPELWRLWLSRVEYEKKWTEYLPDVWCGLDEEGLKIYAHSVRLEMPADRMKQITEKFQAVPEEKANFFLEITSGIFYERWEEYLQEQKKKGRSADRLLMTGYTNLILFSIIFLFTEPKKWEDEIRRAFREFEADMFRWYSSQTQLSAYYFADLTEIYLLLFAGRNGLKIRLDLELEKQTAQIRELVLRNRKLWRGTDGPDEKLMELLREEEKS